MSDETMVVDETVNGEQVATAGGFRVEEDDPDLILVQDTPGGPTRLVPRAVNRAASDHLVKCNVCGFTQRKSDPKSCPNMHAGGWSYAGPIDVSDPSGGDGPLTEPAGGWSYAGPIDVSDPSGGDGPLTEPAGGWSYAGPIDVSDPSGGDGPLTEPDDDDEDDGPFVAEAAEPEGEAETPEEPSVVEKAILHMFGVQDRLDAAVEDHAEKAEVAKTAKKRVESLQEDLSLAVRRVREARTEHEPDPEKFPLFDRPNGESPKDMVNGMFPKPEAIAPLPPDTFAEFCRRRARETHLGVVPGIKPATVKALNDAGLVTVDDFRIKSDALFEANASLTTIKGVTETRLEQITEALTSLAETWRAEWAELHPEEDAAEAEVAEEPAVAEGQESPEDVEAQG